ncbi:G/U mismatch-specific uracil-DNA glycosylase [Propionibacteriaceae bacterium ES.041]|nr:G/U mismatch-specific uracil-DNA glycosylase [Propionibacteriaceae bacterium ES.041]
MPTRDELQQARGVVIPDLLGPDPRLLFIGINPSLWSAAVDAHFARPGNRFWPALRAAGLIDRPVDLSAGMSAGDEAYLTGRGIAISNLAPRATARAHELSRDELRAGAARLAELVRRSGVRVVAVLGVTAYRQGFGAPKATVGRQPEELAGAELWVVPNPSGLNAHETVDSLATAYAEVGRAAGLLPVDGRG